MEGDEQTRMARPRWKNYPEAINFILKRTIPAHPVPRGSFRQLYPNVAKQVNEKFDFGGRKADAVGIKYVTEKYGSDPVFGNRKMQVVHPVKGKANTREKKNLLRAKRAVANGGGSLMICPHCEGNGFVDTKEEAEDEDDMFQGSQGMATDPPTPIVHGGNGAMQPDPANTLAGANSYQGFQQPTGNAGNMYGPSSMAHMPGGYPGPSQPGQVSQMNYQYPPQVPAPAVMGDNNAYGNFQGGIEPNQTFQNTGGWNSAGNAIDQQFQGGQAFGLGPVENQQATPMPPPTVHYGWRDNTTMGAGEIGHQNYGQMIQGGNVPQTNELIHIDPALRSGTVNGQLSAGGGNIIARTPGSGLRPQPNNAGGNAGLYGNSQGGNQATTSAQAQIQPQPQPTPVAGNRPSGPVSAAGANVNHLPNDFSFENPGFNHGLQSAQLNGPLTDTSNGNDTNLDNQNFTINEDFSFLEYLNDNSDLFKV
ncbi:uncharacterized protein GGS22DRAFT_196408 [Annulohypoxylon maeteangense]|uniref:uncharacterized protein n=1 Tax=Annulohypoxylon maeteangense TaxID=1927788 RepID=UPI0020074F99|nr:uncharacterized protein GGS22DRAFT_196408 [Annulohypoxylon maeteangense]KAI0881447.1 hypothetical protein GGS22DRAFT_196408 [Annulohypoxylon maeteangense]